MLTSFLFLGVLPAKIVVGDGSGATIYFSNTKKIFAITLAYDNDNSSNYILYITKKETPGTAIMHSCITLSQNGLTLGSKNVLGTQVINGATSVTQVCLLLYYD